jgi:hypothetical protein
VGADHSPLYIPVLLQTIEMRTIHLATPHGYSIYTIFCEVAVKIEVGRGRKKERGEQREEGTRVGEEKERGTTRQEREVPEEVRSSGIPLNNNPSATRVILSNTKLMVKASFRA